MAVFKPDWNYNVANLLVIAGAIVTGIGAWYDVKSLGLQNQKDIIEIKQIYEAHRVSDNAMDLRQDQKRDDVVKDLKITMKENKDDIKTEIHDLRNDVLRSRK